MKSILTIVLVAITFVSLAQSVIIGQPLINAASSQSVALADFKAAKAVVIIFTSNVCAYDGYYSERLKTLFSKYSSNVQFLMVNSNQEAEETVDKMKLKYDLWSFGVPYLADKDQVWMKALGARKTPEVFVLDPSSGFSVVYSGAIDDNPQLATGVKETYLSSALDNLIAGKKLVSNVRGAGCSMRSK